MNILEELERLNKNVYTPMVFYFPHEIRQYIPEAMSGYMDEDGFFNTMTLFDANGAVGSLAGNIGSMAIYSKPKILKTNLLELIELEDQIKKETFSMIIQEYLNTVSAYEFIYGWMSDNVARDIPEECDKYGIYFTIQSDSIKEHMQEVKERFTAPHIKKPRTLNFEKIIEKGKNLFPVEVKKEAAREKEKPHKNKRKRKMVLPTDVEVDLWLLETVFNVDFNGKK